MRQAVRAAGYEDEWLVLSHRPTPVLRPTTNIVVRLLENGDLCTTVTMACMRKIFVCCDGSYCCFAAKADPTESKVKGLTRRRMITMCSEELGQRWHLGAWSSLRKRK